MPIRRGAPTPPAPAAGRFARAGTPSAPAPPAAPSVASPLPAADFFSGFGEGGMRHDSARITPGKYVVRVVSNQFRISKNPKKLGQVMFVAEMEVARVLQGFEADPSPPDGWPASNIEGESIAMILNRTAFTKSTDSTIMNYLFAILRTDNPRLLASQLTPEDWNGHIRNFTEDPNLAADTYLIMNASKTMTKGPPSRNWTTYSFMPAPAGWDQ